MAKLPGKPCVFHENLETVFNYDSSLGFFFFAVIVKLYYNNIEQNNVQQRETKPTTQKNYKRDAIRASTLSTP